MKLETQLLFENMLAKAEGRSDTYVIDTYVSPFSRIIKEKIYPKSLCCNATTRENEYKCRVCTNCLHLITPSRFSECCNELLGEDGAYEYCTECGLVTQPIFPVSAYTPKVKALPTRVKNYEILFERIFNEPIIGLKLMLKFHHSFEESTGKKDLKKRMELKKKEKKPVLSSSTPRFALTKYEKMMLTKDEKEVLKKEKFENMSEEDQKISKIRCPTLKNVLYYILNRLGYNELKSKIPLPKRPTIKMKDSLLEIQKYMNYKLKTETEKQSTLNSPFPSKEKKSKTIIVNKKESDEESESESEEEIEIENDFDDNDEDEDSADEDENHPKKFDIDEFIYSDSNSGSDSD